MSLDDKGRCCGRKPLDYKGGSWRSPTPQKFCCRCDRAYDRVTGEQIENFAWKRGADGSWNDLRHPAPQSGKEVTDAE